MSDHSAATPGMGRREFLKRATAGAAAVGLTFASARSAMAQGAASERINIGFIGVGGRGGWLATDMVERAKTQNIAIIGVCDVWDVRAQGIVDHVKANNGVDAKRFRDYRELLELPDLDAVVIATPDHWHSTISIDAMQKGLDVYCEKPVTLYWQEAKEVARVAKQEGTVFQCGAPSGSDNTWWTAGDVVRDGGIGPLVWTQGGAFRNDPAGDWNWGIQGCDPNKDLDWDMWLGCNFGLAPRRPYDSERYSRFRKYWDYSGGLATDLLYHGYAHLALGMVPQMPYRVVGAGCQPIHTLRNDNREVPTLFHIVADYPAQHSLNMVATQECQYGVPDMVRGQKGVLMPGGPGIIVKPEPPFEDEMGDLVKSLDCYSDAEVVTEQRDGKTVISEVRVPQRYDWGDHIQNWLDCLRTRKDPTLNAHLAYIVELPIALSVLSYRTGKAIYFDPDREEVVDEAPNLDRVGIPPYVTDRQVAKRG
jgi:hypothetical protein